MNTKHYVSLQAAKKLKELGYNERVSGMIDDDNYLHESVYRTNDELEIDMYSCPSLLEAMDWMEERGIIVIIGWDSRTKKWFFIINRKEHLHVTYNSTFDSDEDDYTDRNECMQKAIEKALEVL